MWSPQELDIVVASLTMTSEREEVIDFIAPYFEQTGISIGNYINYETQYDIKRRINMNSI